MRPDVLKLELGFENGRDMTSGDPPERLVCLGQLVKPGVSIPNEFDMGGLVGVDLQRLQVFPDTHVYEEQWVFKHPDTACIGAIADEAPNETF